MGLVKDRDKLDSVRYFDPLISPEKRYPDPEVVIHIPICLEDISRREGGAERDIRCLLYNIQNFKNNLPTKNTSGLYNEIDIVISVNGFIHFPDFVDVLENLEKRDNGQYNIKIFQRPNIGWQWAAFYEVWQKYRYTETNFYMTMECDVIITMEYWLDYLTSKMLSGIGYLGMEGNEKIIDPNNNYGDVFGIPKRLWRNKDRSVKPMKNEDSFHTRGGWYFCRSELLEDMEKNFGCFTYAMGNKQCLDGVLMGEVGFSQKTKELGWHFKFDKIEELLKKDDERLQSIILN